MIDQTADSRRWMNVCSMRWRTDTGKEWRKYLPHEVTVGSCGKINIRDYLRDRKAVSEGWLINDCNYVTMLLTFSCDDITMSSSDVVESLSFADTEDSC